MVAACQFADQAADQRWVAQGQVLEVVDVETTGVSVIVGSFRQRRLGSTGLQMTAQFGQANWFEQATVHAAGQATLAFFGLGIGGQAENQAGG
ncbi:hypothetical protein D3C76_1326070 [compost metagenome]